MGPRFCAAYLVVLAVLPFSAPFATCTAADLVSGRDANDQQGAPEIHVPSAANEHAMASGDALILPRKSESVTAVTIDDPLPVRTSLLLSQVTPITVVRKSPRSSTTVLRL